VFFHRVALRLVVSTSSRRAFEANTSNGQLSSVNVLRASLASLVELALPSTCAACGTPLEPRADLADASSAPPWCQACDAMLPGCLWRGGARRVRPQPCPEALPPVHAAARYEPPLSRLVTAYKDEDRRDVAAVLAPLLALAVDAALATSPSARRRLEAGNGPVLVVPVPSSRAARRRRGDAPLRSLAVRGLAGRDRRQLVVADALAVRRRVADQAGLDARQRSVNLEHSMGVRPRWAPVLARTDCVLVDDVLTTGATLVEAARALHAGGSRHVVAATVCATQRRAAGVPGLLPPCSG
jgi:predicted amidophosphoribosyltransferase